MARNVEVYVRGHDEASGVLRGVGGALGFLGNAASTALGFVGGTLINNAISGLQTLTSEAVQATAAYEQMGLSLHSLAAKEALASGEARNMEQALRMTADAGEELLSWVQELAIKSPFSAEGVAMAFRTAMAYGFTAEQAQRLTQATIDFASATGATTSSMNQIALALGQMQAKGKLAGQELLQLVNAGVPALQILADHFGVTTAEMSKMVEKGLVPVDEAIDAIVTSMEQDFGGAAERSANSWAGLLGTFEDLKAMGLRALFEGIGEAIQPMVADFAAWLQDEGMTKLKMLGEDLGTVAQSAVAVAQIFQGLAEGSDMWIVGIGKLMELFPQFKDELVVLYDILKAVGEGFDANGLIGGLEALGEQLLTFLPPEVQTAIDTFRQGFEDLGAAIADRGPLLEEQLGKIKAAFEGAFGEIGPQLGENLNAALAAITTIINSDFVTGLIGALGSAISSVISIGLGLVTMISGLITGALQILSGDVEGGLKTIADSVTAGIDAMLANADLSAMLDSWTGVFDNAGAIVEGGMGKIKTIVASKITEAATALATGMSTMISNATTAAGDAAGIGSAIISGITGAIVGGAGKLADALVDAVMGAIEAAMAAAGIASPSAVTEKEVGVPLAQGIVGGLIDEMANAQAAIQAMMTQTVASLQEATGAVGTGVVQDAGGVAQLGNGVAANFIPTAGSTSGAMVTINQNLNTSAIDKFAVGQLFDALTEHAGQMGYINPVVGSNPKPHMGAA